MALTVTILGKDKLSGKLLRIGKKVGQLGFKFAKFGTIAGAAIAGVSVKMAADMENGLREISTLMTNVTETDIRNMGQELESLARSSGQAMDKLTKARYDIVSAGFADAADSAKLLQVSADLAVAGVTEVSTAADILTTTLNAYNLTVEDTVDVSDKLFTIVRLGKTTMDALGGSMGRVLAIAGQAGVNLDEVGAVIATLTANGQSTEEAITAMRGAITELLKPGAELEEVINKLGFATGTAMIESKGFAGAIQAIKEQAEKNNIPMTDLFGNIRAMQAVLPLTGTAAEKFADNLKQMADAGGATAIALSKMEKSFKLDMKKMQQNIASVMRLIGSEIIKIIQPWVKEANDVMSTLGDIGWDNVSAAISGNWTFIMDNIIKITKLSARIIGFELEKIMNNFLTKLPAFMGGISQATADAENSTLDDNIALSIENISNEFKLLGLEVKIFTDEMERAKIFSEAFGVSFSQALVAVQAMTRETFDDMLNQAQNLELFIPISLGEAGIGDIDLSGLIDPETFNIFPDEDELMSKKEFLMATAQLTADELASLSEQWNGQVAGMDTLSFQGQINHIEELGKKFKAAGANEVAVKQWVVEQTKKIEDKKTALTLKGFSDVAGGLASLASINKNASKENFKIWKRAAQAQALVNTYASAVAAYNSLVGIPVVGPALAIAAGFAAVAAGLANVANIERQSFQFGGRVGATPFADTVPSNLSPGEIVSTPSAANMFGNEITRMNQFAESGFSGGGGGQINLTINALDSQSIRDMAMREPEAIAEMVDIVTERSFRRTGNNA